MKIFSKKIFLMAEGNDPEVTVAKIYLNNIPAPDDLLLQTIDYKKCTEVVGVPAQNELIDKTFWDIGFYGDVFVISYNENLIVASTKLLPDVPYYYDISIEEFCSGLRSVVRRGNCDVLEGYLGEEPKCQIVPNNESDASLPGITDYISEHADAFKIVYYPGVGHDFSPLQLFGKYANVQSIYFADYNNNPVDNYSNEPEIKDIRDRLDERAENVIHLTPENFNKKEWADFWPKDDDAWEGKEGAFLPHHHPHHAWGRKVSFSLAEKPQHPFDFYYLGTEGVKTAEVLLENGIFPDVLVLQDHGWGNWATFGGTNSPLYEVMRNHLPAYILYEPYAQEQEGQDFAIWPGYEKIAGAYNPPLHAANAQHRNARFLYKRMDI